MEILFHLCFFCLAIFGIYILSKTRRVYEERKTLSLSVSIGWWILDISYSLLVILASIHHVWRLSINEVLSLISGSTLLILGIILTSMGISEFRSIRKVSGMEVSKLITSGIYNRSRNPQFLGFYLSLMGISLLGRSGYAILLSVIAIIWCHYYIVKIEEPYLERIFGDEYLKYKSNTPRYLKIKPWKGRN